MSTYTIKKDNHSASGLHFGVHFGITEQWYKVNFSKECLYVPADWENDYNKLCGWSYGLHHKNSIRVCWRPYMSSVLHEELSTAIELCIYVYEEATRKISQKTLLVEVEKDYDFDLIYDTTINTILLNFPQLGNGISMDYFTKPFLGYRLYPYIGGDNVATVDTTIKLERL